MRALLTGLIALLLAPACAGRPAVVSVVPAVPQSDEDRAAARAADPDPVEARLGRAELLLLQGERELALGHLTEARAAFDRAVEAVMTAPGGAAADPRLAAFLERLVDRASALELAALASGDGFAAPLAEPASIDALLALSTIDDAPPAPDLLRAVAADLERTTHDIPIPSSDRVVRFVELLQGRLRDFLSEGLARSALYLPMIQRVFRAEGLPLDLAYVPLIESAFKPTALSRASARGVWQFMRATAVELGLRHDWFVDERADPEKATVAAARYLKQLHAMFGDWHLALAAYNAGPGRVQRAIARSGRTDYWSLTRDARYLPRETRDYVPMILAAIIIARNPLQYGFDVAPLLATPVDRLELPGPLDLRRVAEWAGVGVEDVRALNPALRRWTTPLRDPAYELRVPAGTAHLVLARFAEAPPHELAGLQWYTVRRGDTLAGIAQRLKVRRADLAEANDLKPTARLAPGQRLLVPLAPSPAVVAAARGVGPSGPSPAPAAAVPSTVVYRVRPGDTLYAIARRHGVTVQELRAWNGIAGSRIQVGDRLTIHQPAPASAQ